MGAPRVRGLAARRAEAAAPACSLPTPSCFGRSHTIRACLHHPRSGGELVTEVDGVQLYLSKQSATGVRGLESYPHPCTRTPLHPTRNPPTHLLFRYHTDSQPDTLPFSTRALIPPPPTLEPRLTPTHLNPSTHAARCTLCTHGDAKVMLR